MIAKPVVYFIDDSATMREVIKIAFRRENLDVITCHDASSAIDLMDHSAPDVVISDVIMPGRDGYEVCQYVKQHPRFAKTPVILMSGVVNKGVAERAFAVHANELIRKPFQPQDLIARVRHLLSVPLEAEPVAQEHEDHSAVLSSIFNGPVPVRQGYGRMAAGGPFAVPRIMPRPAGRAISAASIAASFELRRLRLRLPWRLPCSLRWRPLRYRFRGRRLRARRRFRCLRRCRGECLLRRCRAAAPTRGGCGWRFCGCTARLKSWSWSWPRRENIRRRWNSTLLRCSRMSRAVVMLEEARRPPGFFVRCGVMFGTDIKSICG